MIQKITIYTKQGDECKVWAWVDGIYAIHKTLTKSGLSRHFWSITHVPTGCSIGQSLERDEIPGILQRRKNYRWHGFNPHESPVCEIVNILPAVWAEEKYDVFYEDEFSEILNLTIPFLKKKHECE